MAVPGSTVLDAGEIVTEIQVPAPAAGIKSTFIKFTIRKSIDFPIVNCAAAVGGGTVGSSVLGPAQAVARSKVTSCQSGVSSTASSP